MLLALLIVTFPDVLLIKLTHSLLMDMDNFMFTNTVDKNVLKDTFL